MEKLAKLEIQSFLVVRRVLIESRDKELIRVARSVDEALHLLMGTPGTYDFDAFNSLVEGVYNHDRNMDTA